MTDNRRSGVAALDKALAVLEVFGPHAPDLRIAEIAELTGLNRSSAQRTLHTLVRCGYLKRDPASAAISLSHRGAMMAHRYLTANHLIDMSMLHLVELNSRTHLQCDLWVGSGNDVVNIARVPSATSAAALAPVGQRWSAARSAPGRAMLALGGSADALDRAHSGCVLDLGETSPNEGTIAAPVLGADGQCIAAVSVSGPLRDIMQGEAPPEHLSAAVAATARALSALKIQPWARTFADQPLPVALADVPDDDDPLFIASVARGLQTLEAFAVAPPALTLTELHKITGNSIPTLQRILDTFMARGYIEKDPRHKTFRLSVRTLDLLFNYQMSDRVLKTVWPRLVRLRDQCGLRCSFCILDDGEIVHLLHVQSHPHIDFRVAYMGRRLPALSTSGGLAILSKLPAGELDHLLSERPIEKLTPHTITDQDVLRNAVLRAHERGYSFTDQQSIPDEVNVAAPIVEPDGRPVGAIVVSAPRRDWTVERLEHEIVPLLLPYTKSLFS